MYLSIAPLFFNTVLAAAMVERAAQPFCSKVTSIVTALHAESTATKFCSSYLHLPAATAGAASTVTVYSATVTQTPCFYRTTGPVTKRAATPTSVAKPSCFKSFTVSSAISSACSCLSIPTTATASTVTVTTDKTVQATPTFKLKSGYNNLYFHSGGFFGDGSADSESFIARFQFGDSCRLQLASGAKAIACGIDGQYSGLVTPKPPFACGTPFPLICTVDQGDKSVHCVADGTSENCVTIPNGQYWYLQVGDLEIGGEFQEIDWDYQDVTITAALV